MENLANILHIAESLHKDGRTDDAIAICNHVVSSHPHDFDANRILADLLAANDMLEDALTRLADLKEALPPSAQLNSIIAQHAYKGVLRYNDLLSSGQTEKAAKLIYSIARARPTQDALMHALNLSHHLHDTDRVIEYSDSILQIDPMNHRARAVMVGALHHKKMFSREFESRLILALFGKMGIASNINNTSELMYMLVAKYPQSFKPDMLDTLVRYANSNWDEARLPVEDPLYIKTHFTLTHIRKVDSEAMAGQFPVLEDWPTIGFATSNGTLTDLEGVRETAIKTQAEAVIFVAADQVYAERFGKIFLKWILKHRDIPCLVVVHIIGGITDIGRIAQTVGIDDPMVIYSGCAFDKSEIIAPAALSSAGEVSAIRPYYQSARYIWLGFMLEQFGLPVLVSDIDMLLQRGIKDLFDNNRGNDVVFRRAGNYLFDHFAANLLLVNPTETSVLFARFLRSYLTKALGSDEIPIGIDQLSLLLARTYLLRTGNPRFGELGPKDNNNILSTNYYPNEYRFFSLHTWFDVSVIPEPE